MRIAITTWHTGSNSGTFFQCFGLYEYLKSRGHEVKVIDYVHQPEDFIARGIMYYLRQPIGIVKRKIQRQTAHRKERIFQKPFSDLIKQRDRKFDTAWDLLDKTKPIRTQEQFEKLNDEFDAFIVGSDQVWNSGMLNRRYFLDYVAESKVKAAYCPSVGTGTIFPRQQQVFKRYLQTFEYISTREKVLADLLHTLVPEKNVRHLLDPSMLYPRERYIEMAVLPEYLEKGKYVLCYFTPNNPYQQRMIKEYAAKRGLEVVVMGMFGYSWTVKGATVVCPSPSEFVGCILNAAAVFTSSFHCTIFSIMLHKDLFVFERKRVSKTGDINQRYAEQLVTYGIEHRYIRVGEQLNSRHLASIDYKRVESIFQNRLLESKDFLNQFC